MVRDPACCEKPGLKKGPWTPEEDHKLMTYIQTHGHCSWRALPKQAGLARCGKSCRLRWTNYLRPGIKRGHFSIHEENSIIQLHSILGNRWSTIATHLPGRTDNEIKNHWNTRLRKRLLKMGIDPSTHRPWPVHQPPYPPPPPTRTIPPMNNLLLSLLQPQACGQHTSTNPCDPSAILKSLLLNVSSCSPPPPITPTNVAPVPPAPAPTAPLPAPLSFPPVASTIDPSLLAAAETRLILDVLKINSTHESHNPDHDLNHLITRLLLVKLLQQGVNGGSHHGAVPCPPPPSVDNKPPMQHILQEQRISSSLCAPDRVLYNQGLHSMQPQHVHDTSSSAQPVSSYLNPNFLAPISNSSHNGGGIPTSVLSSMSNSSYQQRLLQALPFLAEAAIDCSSNAPDDLSSNKLRHVNVPLIPSSPSSASLSSLQQQPPALWPGTVGPDNHTVTSGAASLLTGMPTTLMAWEELWMSKGGDREFNASSSTGNTSSSSTLSSASHAAAAPDTPSNNSINVQDYWSNLLNLISPNNNTHQ